MFLTVRGREWSLFGRIASSWRRCSKDASIETHVSRKTISTMCFLTVGEGKKVPSVTGRKRRWRRLRGGQRRTQASREEEHARWAGRSGVALQTNNLGCLNPVKRRTSSPPSLPSCNFVPLPRFSQLPLLDDLAGPGVRIVMTFARESTKAQNRRKLLCRGHVAFSPV